MAAGAPMSPGMATFPRLRRALQALEHERRVAQLELVEVERERSRRQDEVVATEQRLEEVRRFGCDDPLLDVAMRTVAHAAGARIQGELEAKRRDLDEHARAIAEPAREKMQEASTRVRSVEFLLERRQLELEASLLATEGRLLDESGQNRYFRKTTAPAYS
jgi:hypothetical protein